MRIGIIVDGQAEYASIPLILERITTPCTVLNPLFAPIQPLSTPGQIVRSVTPGLRLLAEKTVDRAVLLIDLERRTECPGLWAHHIEVALQSQCNGLIKQYHVVIKNRTYENWLLSDTDALRSMRSRFTLSNGDQKSLAPNKADHVDALAMFRKIAMDKSYEKVHDSTRILSNADPLRMAANSRSFRRLLRILKVPDYLSQSRHPHQPSAARDSRRG